MTNGPEKDQGRGSEALSSWSPLKYPIFRWIWMANVVSNIGTWMQSTAMAWVMTTLDPSAIMVSLVQTASSFPIFLLAIPAGAIADVVDRRRIIIVTQIWMLISAAVLGVLAMLNLTTSWSLLLLVLALGIGNALNAPAWQAIIPELVPRKMVHSAVALNSAGFNLARSVGPALGGFVLVLLGAGPTFMFNAASFLGVIVVLLLWKRPPMESALPAERIVAAMRTGIRFVRYAPALQAVFVRALCFILCASSLMALLPLFARDYLHAGPGEYGLLLGAFGLGAVGGAGAFQWIGRKTVLDKVAALTNIAFAASLSFLGLVHVFFLDCIAMFVAGAAWLVLLSNFNGSVQSIVPAWVRGRCLAVYMLIFFGGMAAGSTAWGAIAHYFGVDAALHGSAAGLILSLLLTVRFKLISGAELDLRPSAHWSVPAVTFEPELHEGPVMVMVEYRVRSEDWYEFGIALRRLRRARMRGGAFSWTVFVDLAEPEKICETFLVESWLEHLRMHERQTVVDKEIQEKVRAFHNGEGQPRVIHFLAKSLPDV